MLQWCWVRFNKPLYCTGRHSTETLPCWPAVDLFSEQCLVPQTHPRTALPQLWCGEGVAAVSPTRQNDFCVFQSSESGSRDNNDSDKFVCADPSSVVWGLGSDA